MAVVGEEVQISVVASSAAVREDEAVVVDGGVDTVFWS